MRRSAAFKEKMNRYWVVLALLCIGCEPFEEPLPRRDRLHFPIGMALHPNGNYLYVVNSNFDGRYAADRGSTIAVVDTRTLQLYSLGGAFLPSFAGYAALNEASNKLYVTARQGNSLVALDVSADGSALYCGRDDSQTDGLSADGFACTIRTIREDGNARVPSDPFGVAVTTIQRRIGDQEVPIDVVGMAHINSANVSALALPGQDISAATLRISALIENSNQITIRPNSLDMVVAGRGTNRLVVFSPFIGPDGRMEALIRRGQIELSRVSGQSVDARGVSFSRDGRWLYTVTRFPNLLHIFRVLPSNVDTGAGVQYDLDRTVNICLAPSEVVSHVGPDGRELLYVTCYRGRRVQVIEPRQGIVLADVELDAAPYHMVTEAGMASRCRFPGDTCRGFITMFNDSPDASKGCVETNVGCGSVAVIDLDPASERYHQIIAKVH
jgi:hypothetical protein